MDKGANSFVQWVVCTGIAAVTMTIGISSYMHNFVFSREEGKKIELDIRRLEGRVEKVETENRSDIKDMRGKIDDIYKMLVERLSRGR